MTDSLSIKTKDPRPLNVVSALSLMTVLQILGTSCVLALTALAPIVAADVGIGEHWIGYQISLIYFSGMFASAFAGAIVAALGTRNVLLIETVLFGAGLVLLSTGQLWLMILASLFIGVGYGLNNPASSEILQTVTPNARRNLIFSIKQTGVPIGAVVANLCLPALVLALGGHWQWAILVYAASLAAMFLALHLRVPAGATARKKTPFASVLSNLIEDQKHILTRANQRGLAFIGGVFSACQLMATAFVVVALVEQGWSAITAGLVGATMHAIGAVGRISWGIAADRFGTFNVLSTIGVLIAVLSFLLVWLGSLPAGLQAACFVGLGFVASGWNGVMLAGIAEIAPEGRVGRNTGASLVYTFIGVIIGPSIFAIVYAFVGSYALCFALVTLFGLAGAVLARTTRRAIADHAHPS